MGRKDFSLRPPSYCIRRVMTDQEPPKGDRIAKLLARAGIASRRDIERMIGEGRIALNGVTLDTPATVLTTLDGITVDGHAVAAPPPAQLFLYHKPPGLLVTEHDPAGRPIIYDHLPRDLPRVVPVGRLDLNTEGLLLLTTDGGFKRQLELPATGVERTYRARAYGDVTQAQLEDLIEGIEIEGMRYGPIDANLERRTGANVWIEMTLTEGKNREVRRVLEHLGLQVSRLIRTRYGPFVLGELMPGEVGEVRGADIGAFRRTLDGPRRSREPMANVEVEARAKPAAPPPVAAPAPRPPVEDRRPRPASIATARPASSGGWGSRTRPSRPTADAAPADRFRGARPRDDAPRAERPATGAPRVGGYGDRPRRDAPRGDQPAGDAPRQGGGRSDRQRRAGAGDARPGGGTGRGGSFPPRQQAERASPRAERSRSFRDRRDDDGAPARPAGDRSRGSAPASGRDDRGAGPSRGPARGGDRPGGKSPGRTGPGKGPAGGRGHPPRAPKGRR
jgi:23S rRNA pseudouridine2605 synthase